MNNVRRYYWDSSVFCSFFNKEQNRHEIVSDLLKDAHSGKSEIVTSSFTLTEVLRVKNSAAITQDKEKMLETFFEYPFIKFVNPDRAVCERARYFVWKHGMKPKDAVHMATAEFAARMTTIHALFSWDNDFTDLNGKIDGISFALRVPFMAEPLLNFGEAEGQLGEAAAGA
jgi:predicted nucleic acid-binding protein